ncbi:hypothetical protein [Parvibaculum sp.]|uniref:hypothetical protein n=1 Tax=Parvibaculum sp. TaxID=2024848 RepID=UPI0027330BE9|nr:hypothetical protein [Parvibaculum sp.]MDP3327196.1 hypothetical protein [Parvibaculum sp.]
MAGAERWREAVLRAPLWEGERRAYAATISYSFDGQFAGIISSDYKYVEDIEHGRPPRDLKRMLDTSMKVRTSKAGRRYLIIPIRHNTPGHSAHASAMPAGVHAEARTLSPSKITGHGRRVSGTGALDIRTKQQYLVRARKYQWGGRLPAGLAPKMKASHKSDPFAGMVRFDTGTKGAKSSTYMTFRVMAEGQPGWIVAAKPGLNLVKGVVDVLKVDAEKIFGAAVQQDLSGS